MQLNNMDVTPPPVPRIPASVSKLPIGASTFGQQAARAARFDVEWGAPGTAPALVARSAAAKQLAANETTAAKLRSVAGALALHAEDGPNRLGRISFALDVDAYIAARLLPRIEYALTSAADGTGGTPAATDLVMRNADALRRQDADAEFLPRADEIVVGPEASQTLLGLPGDGTVAPATPTRATYVLRHELAHAARPVSVDALSQPATHVFEEARADLVARGDARLPELGHRLGLAFDANELAADQTYPYQRGIVGMFLAAAGMPIGTAAATQLLAATPGEAIPDALAAAITARLGGGDPSTIAAGVRTSSSSQSAARQYLLMLGLQV